MLVEGPQSTSFEATMGQARELCNVFRPFRRDRARRGVPARLAFFLLLVLPASLVPALLATPPACAGAAGETGQAVESDAAEGHRGTSPPDKTHGWAQAGRDTRYLLRRPLRLDRQDRYHLFVAGGSVAALYVLRQEIRDRAEEHRDENRSAFLQDVRKLSRGGVAPALALLFYAASLATRRERERETGLLLLESALFSAAGAAGGSFVLASERPEDGDAIHFFDSEGHGVSVDAALAASLVEPLRCQYLRVEPGDAAAGGRGGRRALKWGLSGLLYTAAGLVAYQRIDDSKHWAPDATLGMLLGLGVGRTLCEAHGRYRGPETPRERRVSFGPVLGPAGAGVGLRVRLGR